MSGCALRGMHTALVYILYGKAWAPLFTAFLLCVWAAGCAAAATGAAPVWLTACCCFPALLLYPVLPGLWRWGGREERRGRAGLLAERFSIFARYRLSRYHYYTFHHTLAAAYERRTAGGARGAAAAAAKQRRSGRRAKKPRSWRAACCYALRCCARAATKRHATVPLLTYYAFGCARRTGTGTAAVPFSLTTFCPVFPLYLLLTHAARPHAANSNKWSRRLCLSPVPEGRAPASSISLLRNAGLSSRT